MKGSILTPVDTFRLARGENLTVAFPYVLFVVFTHVILASLVSVHIIPVHPGISLINQTWRSTGPFSGIALIFLLFTAGIFLTFAWGLWLHIWVYVFGGRKKIQETLKAVIYGSTPFMLFGWIPLVGIAALLWSVALQAIGIREMQGISPGRAVLAFLLAAVIILILATILVGWLWIGVISYGSIVPLKT